MEVLKDLLSRKRTWVLIGLFLGQARADQLHDLAQVILSFI